MSPDQLQAGALGILTLVLVGVGRFLRLIVLEAREHRHQLVRLTVIVAKVLNVSLEEVDALVGPAPSKDGGGTMGRNFLRSAGLLGLAVVVAACAGCVRVSDGTLSLSTPASSLRADELDEALRAEQAERQAEDAEIRKGWSEAVLEHRQAVEDALAALRSDQGAEAEAIRGALKSTAEDLRAGLDPTQRLAQLRAEALEHAATLAARAETNARKASQDAFDKSVDALDKLEKRQAEQRERLESKLEQARQGEVPWVEILAASVGATGAGAYTLNRHRNRTRAAQLQAAASRPAGGPSPPGAV